MNDETKIDPGHQSPRTFLRVGGPILILLGLVLMISGGIKMFSPAFSAYRGPSAGKGFPSMNGGRHDSFESTGRSAFGGFGMVALGMLCLGGGAAMTKFGYMGRVARYVAAEIVPVATDTFNYAAENTQQGVGQLAAAIGKGLRGETASADPVTHIRCQKCNAENPSDAKFCSQCGAAMLKNRA
jgi:ribosomal protein L40E